MIVIGHSTGLPRQEVLTPRTRTTRIDGNARFCVLLLSFLSSPSADETQAMDYWVLRR